MLRQAVAAHQAGRLPAAAAAYAQVRRLAPRAFDAWHLGGMVELQRQQFGPAAELLSRARALNPRDVTCLQRLGLALQGLGRLPAALEALTAATRLNPQSGEAWYHLGNLHAASAAEAAARQAWQEAVRCRPDLAEAHDRLGVQALKRSEPAAAMTHFEAAMHARPDWAQAWCNFALACIQCAQWREAETALEHAIHLAPNLGKVHALRGLLWQQTYRLAEAVTAFEQALAIDPMDLEAWSGRLLTLHYPDAVARDTLAEAHREFGHRLASWAKSMPPRRLRSHGSDDSAPSTPTSPATTDRAGPVDDRNRTASQARLRVGFMSTDLRRHSVAWFLLPLLAHLDRRRFELRLYHDHAIEDDVSARLRACADHWLNLHGLSDEAATSRLREEGLDVAVDLNGHTGVHRLGVLARRVAPVQLTYLGYPDTTGLTTMDYRFVDPVTDPAPTADAFAVERLVRFAPTAWAYAPPPDAPAVVLPPSAREVGVETGVVFGSFNTFAKVSAATIAVWSQILRQLPGSRLMLKSAGLTAPTVRADVEARFARHGIAVERLMLRDRTNTVGGHLAIYAEVDIALDPFPYNGTTTTCEALWMGRPVVTLRGDRHAGRVGASLLRAIGREAWVAPDAAAYVEIAVRLAEDRNGLAGIAGSLRTEMAQSDLFDHVGQARRFGAALLECWAATSAQGSEISAPIRDERKFARRDCAATLAGCVEGDESL